MQAGTYFLCFENTEIMFSEGQFSKSIGHVSVFSEGMFFPRHKLSENIAMISERMLFPRDANFQITIVEAAWSLTSNVEKTQFFKDPFYKNQNPFYKDKGFLSVFLFFFMVYPQF